MIRALLMLALCAMLAGCNGGGEPIVVLTQTYPPECFVDPSEWKKLSAGPARKTAVARNYRENKERFRTNAANQRICRAGLVGDGA